MKLYHTPGTCSLIPNIVLREAGFPFEVVLVDLYRKTTAQGEDFLAINPKGKVPALELDDGQVLTEAAVIVQYLADKAPEKGLSFAPGTMQRVRMLEWLNFLASDVHKSFAAFFPPDATEDYKQAIREKIAAHFGYIDKQLAGRRHLTGETFTIADAYLFGLSMWARPNKIDLAPFSNLRDFQERVGARSSVKDAMKT